MCWGQCLRSGPHGDLDLIHASDLLRGVLVRGPQESEGQSGGMRRMREGVPVAGRLLTRASTEDWGCCRITRALGEVADLCHLPARSRCTFQVLLKTFVKWRTVLSPGALEIQVQNLCGIAVGEEGGCTPPVAPGGAYLPASLLSKGFERGSSHQCSKGRGAILGEVGRQEGGHTGRSGPA